MVIAARLLLALLAGLWVSAAALAEVVTVRSGEHGDFTRLVVELGDGRAWQFGRAGGGYLLRVEDPALRFDLARVFERVPRTRLAGLIAEGNGLRLALAPGTFALLAAEGRGRLIIDIRNGTAPKTSPYETAIAGGTVERPTGQATGPLPHPVSARSPSAPGLGATLSYRPEANNAASLPIYWRDVLGPDSGPGGWAEAQPESPTDPGPETTAAPSDHATGPDADHAAPDTGPAVKSVSVEAPTEAPPLMLPLDLPVPGFDAAPPPVPPPQILALEEELRQQVARAASQGLAEAAVDKVVNPNARRTGATDRHAPDSAEIPAGPAQVSAAEDQIAYHAETSMDRDARDNPRAVTETEDGQGCPDEEMIDLRHWGDERAASLQLAEAHNGLTGEFDRPDEAAVLRLARLDLFFGMGAEARAVINGFDLQTESAPYLVDISYMVDDRAPPAPSAFEPFAQCDTSASLWAFLSAPDSAPPPTVNLAALTRSFSGLPASLRLALGPRLSNRLIAAGALDAARTVRNAVARKAEDDSRPLQMIQAEIALGEGDADAHDKLTEMAEGSDDLAARALILSVEARLRNGEAVPASDVEDLAALAFERRNGESADALAALEIEARAASGDLPYAFERLTEWGREAPAAKVRQTALKVFAVLAAEPDDAAFLGEYFARKPLLPVEADADLRLQLADRLGGLGLYEEAHLLLPGALRTTDAGRLVLARAAAAAFRHEEVIALTGGLEAPEARTLRAGALDALGDHAAAADLYAALGLTAAAAGAAWRGGDLDKARADGGYGKLADLVEAGAARAQKDEPAATAAEAGATLVGSRSLLAESSELRSSLAVLLARPNAPAAP